jgi:asparagine synthase (glutamine-hydrolysing)
MCGILGFSSNRVSFNAERFRQNIQLLNHRGPDHNDYWLSADEKNFMGFARLAIMDLSPLGNQPMCSSSKEFRIIFNGEIYNHLDLKKTLIKLGYEFNSRSDTEVLLNSYIEWGENCLQKLEGMFAFALMDKENKKLMLARDIAGEKPLFYYSKEGLIAYASELKPLVESIEDSKEININAFNHYLGNGYIPREESIYSNINKLIAGEYLIFDIETGKVLKDKYWDLNKLIAKKLKPQKKSSEITLTNKLEQLLETSVSQKLISDAPLGMMLSGGVDSSIMVAIASRFKDKLNTYTVIYPDNKVFNEQKYAKLISKRFSTNHHELEANSIEPELIEKLAYYFDEPMTDSSMIPTYILCEEMSNFCKVAIGGDGGDELFGGYNHYSRLLLLNNLSKFIPLPIRKIAINNILKILPHNLNFSSSLMFDLNQRSHLLMNQSRFLKNIEFSKNEKGISENDFITRMTAHDFQNFMSEDILVKIDRASMAHSLEIRSPFLDSRIIDFAFTEVPSKLKVHGQKKKILLKTLAKKILPSEFDLQRKQGFSIPINNLLIKGHWHDYFHNRISSFEGIEINKEYALTMLSEQKKGAHNGEKLFSLVQFICWHEKHINSNTLKSTV